jgi:hypothetical protein
MNAGCKECQNGHGMYLEQVGKTTEKVTTQGFHIQITDLPTMK